MGLQFTSTKRMNDFESKVKESFLKVKEELTEHLDAINENTTEMQSSHENFTRLSAKVEKLSDKVDKILMLLEEQEPKSQFKVEALTLREQEVFIALYTKDEPLSYEQITRRTGLPVDMVKKVVQTIIIKGIPIIKRLSDDDILLELDSEFRILQAKTNILELNEQILKHMDVLE